MKNALLAAYRTFRHHYTGDSVSNRLRKQIEPSVTYEYIAEVHGDINYACNKCESIGVTYHDVWQQKHDANRKILAETSAKVDYWWLPGWPATAFILLPPLLFHTLDLSCSLGAVLPDIAISASIAMPIQIMDRYLSFKKALREHIALIDISSRYHTSKSTPPSPIPPSATSAPPGPPEPTPAESIKKD